MNHAALKALIDACIHTLSERLDEYNKYEYGSQYEYEYECE